MAIDGFRGQKAFPFPVPPLYDVFLVATGTPAMGCKNEADNKQGRKADADRGNRSVEILSRRGNRSPFSTPSEVELSRTEGT